MRLEIHKDAMNDLWGIKTKDASVAAKLGALIEQLRADPALIARLLSAEDDDVYSTSKWWSLFRQLKGFPSFRLKFRCLEQQGIRYRIIYAYHYPSQTIVILAVVARSLMDYDNEQDPIRLRIINTLQKEYAGG